jgi:hypothetical protein
VVEGDLFGQTARVLDDVDEVLGFDGRVNQLGVPPVLVRVPADLNRRPIIPVPRRGGEVAGAVWGEAEGAESSASPASDSW